MADENGSIVIAIIWMSVISLLLFWLPFVGPLIAGATVVFVPSAFAVNTGKTHWQPLLQARAIENGCFVIAAAQSGRHDDGRTTYGHAIAIDPWGHVMVDMENGLGATLLTLDLESVAKTRQMIPSLANEQSYRSLTETPRPLKAAG